MFLIAACVCEGLCEALKSALVLDEPLLKTAREIEQRIKQQIEQASDEAQQAWRDFQERPRENRGAFINVWLKSVSVSESMLYKCTCRFRNEVEHRKFVDFYTLLASNRFTHEQIKHICRQVDPELPGLGEGANQQDMAAWVYRYSNTNKVGRHLLICKVLETNPAAVLQLTYQS
jgi:hypothetical protein